MYTKACIGTLIDQDQDWQEFIRSQDDVGVVAQIKEGRIEKKWFAFRATLEKICIETKAPCDGNRATESVISLGSSPSSFSASAALAISGDVIKGMFAEWPP